MATPPDDIPLSSARSLCRTLRLLRTETAARTVEGTIAVSAGDLLGAAGGVTTWLDDLVAATVTADGDHIALPARQVWELRHIAYTISAVLVWAEAMRAEGRLTTSIPPDTLAAWSRVEELAGMPGRTAEAFARTLDLADADDETDGEAPDAAGRPAASDRSRGDWGMQHDAAGQLPVRLRDLEPATR